MTPGKIVMDGISYNNVDEMPADVRSKYEAAMRIFDSPGPEHRPEADIAQPLFRGQRQRRARHPGEPAGHQHIQRDEIHCG